MFLMQENTPKVLKSSFTLSLSDIVFASTDTVPQSETFFFNLVTVKSVLKILRTHKSDVAVTFAFSQWERILHLFTPRDGESEREMSH